MSNRICLWWRDQAILRELRRSPMSAAQIARMFRMSARKASERGLQYHRAGLVRRLALFQQGMQGRAPYVFYIGACPSPFSLQHQLMIAEVRVQAHLSFTEESGATFLYTDEFSMTSIRPDAALTFQRGEGKLNALVLFENDRSTEKQSILAHKFSRYASAFDTGLYLKDWHFLLPLQGFRVAVLFTSPKRLQNVQRLISTEGFDFVILGLMDDMVKDGLHSAFWKNHRGDRVDLFGRCQ